MHFDEILEKVGGFGRYQICQFFLLGLVGILPGFQNLCMVFLGGSAHRHWCHVPEVANLSYGRQKYIAIPKTGRTYSSCRKFDEDFSQFSDSDFKSWNRSVKDFDRTVECTAGWEYDRLQYTSTIASQFDLVCSRSWMVALATTIYMTGLLVGVIFFGHLSDRYGRRPTYYAALMSLLVFGLAAAFAPNYVAFVILRFFAGMTTIGFYTTAFVIVVEIVGKNHRVSCGILFQAWFAVGYTTLPGLAYFIRDHRHLQVAMVLPIIPMISFWWLINESPRWLITQGRFDEALAILQKYAKKNGYPPLPAGIFDKQKEAAENLSKEQQESKEHHANILDLLQYPYMRRKALNVFFNWFVNSLVYYGLSFSMDSLGGNVYLNTFIMGIIEMPSLVATVYIADKLGRRYSLALLLILGGVACALCIPFLGRPKLHLALVTTAMLGKFAITSTFAIIYLYSSEIFPTVVRNEGVGSGSMCARVGGLLAPQIGLTYQVWPPMPSMFFGVFAITAGLLSLLLPETLNQELPETLEEGENFIRKSEHGDDGYETPTSELADADDLKLLHKD